MPSPLDASRIALVVACAMLALVSPRWADACGGFFRRGTTEPLPSLSVEQVLLVWDAETKTEHLVREVTFSKATETFGFVVPTPSKPEVDKVDDAPFARLHRSFPFRDAPEPKGRGGAPGAAAASGSGVAAVQVLETKRVGSFTAFVLKATDGGALKGWLERNKLDTTIESRAWLDRYVTLGFYFVAMRFEPKLAKEQHAKATRSVVGETIRLTFAAPLPYYPYLEPDREADPERPDRLLALWFVSQEERVPVARVEGAAPARWKRPWQDGRSERGATPSRLQDALGEKLFAALPEALRKDGATFVVQTFEDQKTSRRSWGDVVLVPRAERPAGAATPEERQFAAKLLDPAMVSP